MAQRERELAALESARTHFGSQLRYWRKLRKLSQRALGDLTHDSGAQIAKVEKAVRWPTQDFVRRMDEALETGGALEQLLPRVDAEHRYATSRQPSDTSSEPPDPNIGLTWGSSTAATVETATELWRTDMRRRTAIVGAAWASTAVAPAVRRWLGEPDDRDTSHSGVRRVGKADVGVMWSMCRAFAETDHHVGGGYARTTLVQFLDDVVAPLLKGTYDNAMGRELHVAAARLSNLAGFMCFDSGRQGLGQRYLIQALRLAKSGRDRALGAHILADMSMQSQHLGRTGEAITLADAGNRTAKGCGSRAIEARCHALLARAHAVAGDKRATTKAMTDAEAALERAQPDDGPFWIRFFTEEQLAAEFMYAADDLGHQGEVRRLAPEVLRRSSGMERRQVLASATLARSYVDTDLDRACGIVQEALPVTTSLTSTRVLESMNRVRSKLSPYSHEPAVAAVEHDFRQLAGPATT